MISTFEVALFLVSPSVPLGYPVKASFVVPGSFCPERDVLNDNPHSEVRRRSNDENVRAICDQRFQAGLKLFRVGNHLRKQHDSFRISELCSVTETVVPNLSPKIDLAKDFTEPV